MLTALRFLYLLSLGVWLGTIVFHSFFVAPTVFANFPQQMAGDIVSRLFPKYYLVGFVCGGLCTVLPLVLWRWGKGPTELAVVALLGALMWGMTLFAGTVVHTHAATLRSKLSSGNVEVREAFARWHRVAVMLNLAVLATGLGVTWLVARQID